VVVVVLEQLAVMLRATTAVAVALVLPRQYRDHP
jgi:hypothetical protein